MAASKQKKTEEAPPAPAPQPTHVLVPVPLVQRIAELLGDSDLPHRQVQRALAQISQCETTIQQG